MKIRKLTTYILLVTSILSLVLPGCINKSPIDQAVLCKEVTASGEPQQITDTFTPDVKTIYCSVKLSAISAKSSVKAEWYIAKSDEAGFTNYPLGAETAAAETTYIVFAFARADRLLPKGDYQIKLYFDNKFVQAVPFKIKGDAAISAAALSEVTLCTSIDPSTNKPLDKVDTFANNISTIYCSIKVQGADFNTKIKMRLTYVKGELQGITDRTVAEMTKSVEGSEYISFPITRADNKGFPIGDYSLTLFIDDKEKLNLPFKVVDVSQIPGPILAGVATCTLVQSSDNVTVTMTGSFAANIDSIYCKFKIINAQPGTELKMRWVLDKNTRGEIMDSQVNEETMKVEGTNEFIKGISRKSDEFPKGDYFIMFWLNGDEKLSLPFKVR